MQSKRKYYLKIVAVAIFLVCINTYVLTRTQEIASALDKGTLVVGMELKFPPFETMDEKGNPMGVSVDLAQAIGEVLGVDVVIKSVDYQGLIPALQSHNIDLILSSMTVTDERLKSINFSEEYARSDLGLALHKSVDINGYEELNSANYTIAVKQGNLAESWAEANLPNATIKQFSEVSAAMLDVNNGASHAFIYDPLSLIEASSNLTQTKLLLTPLPGVKGWGIGMRKNDEKLLEEVNSALAQIKASGFFDEMRQKYLKEEVEKYESYGLQYFF
ncbi:MAG: transporter substrate-binding domain-containing protein [Cellulosilyticaceae bacterium]